VSAPELTPLLTPEDLAARYAVTRKTVLEWFHQGRIPAEVATGRIFRFDAEKVAKALAKEARAYRPRMTEQKLNGMVPVI
jgi:excisionase family DNA binding protein